MNRSKFKSHVFSARKMPTKDLQIVFPAVMAPQYVLIPAWISIIWTSTIALVAQIALVSIFDHYRYLICIQLPLFS